ncbi:MAG: hypothetical protein ACRC92_11335 [Peptostreptococcaceae bacterium]
MKEGINLTGVGASNGESTFPTGTPLNIGGTQVMKKYGQEYKKGFVFQYGEVEEVIKSKLGADTMVEWVGKVPAEIFNSLVSYGKTQQDALDATVRITAVPAKDVATTATQITVPVVKVPRALVLGGASDMSIAKVTNDSMNQFIDVDAIAKMFGSLVPNDTVIYTDDTIAYVTVYINTVGIITDMMSGISRADIGSGIDKWTLSTLNEPTKRHIVADVISNKYKPA